MGTYYVVEKKCLAVIRKKSTPQFWDRHWQKNTHRIDPNYNSDGIFVPLVRKYLKHGSSILEGGCGNGHIVYALYNQGYKVIGIDNARRTISEINHNYPQLKVEYGDIRHLKYPDNYFDGYISGGVIEHFPEGYSNIIAEMYRVSKKGGYVFISFPHLSLLRKIKINLNLYKKLEYKQLLRNKNFYQYILNENKVISDFEQQGFVKVRSTYHDAIKGFKDEVPAIQPLLQKLYDSTKFGNFKLFFNIFLCYFSSHIVLLLFKKQ